jgi:transporter family-2 protein
MTYFRYAIWAALAGAFIPVMAVLNARLGRTLGEPMHAAFLLFVVGLVATGLTSLLLTGRLPSPTLLGQVELVNYGGGLIVGFYVVSITIIAPRFGVGNAILFVMTAQVFSSAAIDQFGWFGAVVRPVTAVRLAGLALILMGLALSQIPAMKVHPATLAKATST